MKYDKKVFQCLVLITQFGINMLVPIFFCFFAGIFLDRKLGTSFFMVVLFFVGALAGFRNIYVLARRIAGIRSDSSAKVNKEAMIQKEDKGSSDESHIKKS